jgi:hypothetical protein
VLSNGTASGRAAAHRGTLETAPLFCRGSPGRCSSAQIRRVPSLCSRGCVRLRREQWRRCRLRYCRKTSRGRASSGHCEKVRDGQIADGVLLSYSFDPLAVGLTKAPVAVSPPHRGASFSGFVFRGDGRQACEPPAQIIREDERAAPALDGAKLAALDCPIEFGPTGPGDLASLRNIVREKCVHLRHHRLAGMVPASTPAVSADDDDAYLLFLWIRSRGLFRQAFRKMDPRAFLRSARRRASTLAIAAVIALSDPAAPPAPPDPRCSRSLLGTAHVITVMTSATNGDGLGFGALEVFAAVGFYPCARIDQRAR